MPRDWIQIAHQCIISGGRDLYSRLPNAVTAIIQGELWKSYTNRHGKRFASFPEFVTGELELTWEDLRTFCKKDQACVRMLDEVLPPVGGHGGDHRPDDQGDNIPLKSQRGTSAAHALRRLKRDNPELAKQVMDGELTAHAAAIQAGFRKPFKSIPIDTPASAVSALLRVFTRDQLLNELE